MWCCIKLVSVKINSSLRLDAKFHRLRSSKKNHEIINFYFINDGHHGHRCDGCWRRYFLRNYSKSCNFASHDGNFLSQDVEKEKSKIIRLLSTPKPLTTVFAEEPVSTNETTTEDPEAVNYTKNCLKTH